MLTVGHKKIGWDGVDWIHLDQDIEKWLAVMQLLLNVRVPYSAAHVLSS